MNGKSNTLAIILGIVVLFVLMPSCRKQHYDSDLVGHWGLEMHVRWEADENDSIVYDTVYHEPVVGKGYEILFESDGTGWLKLNDSPALINKFNLTYDYDPTNMKVMLHCSQLLYILYGYQYADENEVTFAIDELDKQHLTVWWKNTVSEDKPFHERFFFVPIWEE